MKRLRLTLLVLIALISLVNLTSCTPLILTEECDLIRIHIVANSNSDSDQKDKYLVRDAIKNYLEDALHEKNCIIEARSFIQNQLPQIRQAAILTLESQVQVRFSREFFPTRAYSDLVIESGFFYALTITIGEGRGDNWWCVIYPPLCYLAPINSAGSFRYRSIILEWFRK